MTAFILYIAGCFLNMTGLVVNMTGLVLKNGLFYTYSAFGVENAETGERFPPLTHSALKLTLLVWLHLGP